MCTANIARSPYAERRARQLLGDVPIAVASAGVPGYPGREMDTTMAAQLADRGGDPAGHESRSLSDEIMATTDLVLTFEFAQHRRVLDRWPDQAGKVFGFHQFAEVAERLSRPATGPRLVLQADAARKPDRAAWDIGDPYRRGRAVGRVAADQIDALLARVLPVLTGETVD